MTTFNFDEWKKLAEENPDEFEAQRKKALLKALQDIPDADKRHRLMCMLWKQDKELRNKTGGDRLNHVVSNFWKQVGKFKQTLESI